VSVVDNPAWADGQLSSLICGLNAVDDGRLEAVLMTLVDVPLVAPATVRRLIDTWRDARLPAALAATAFYAWRPGVLGPLLAGLAVYMPLHIGLGW